MKTTLPEAVEIANKLKKRFKFGTDNCPGWFKNTCTPMQQDGSFSVAVCIPSWDSMNEEEKNSFLEPFEGIHITLRVVTPPKPYIKKTPEEK